MTTHAMDEVERVGADVLRRLAPDPVETPDLVGFIREQLPELDEATVATYISRAFRRAAGPWRHVHRAKAGRRFTYRLEAGAAPRSPAERLRGVSAKPAPVPSSSLRVIGRTNAGALVLEDGSGQLWTAYKATA
jgi:hypothetical protein